MSKPEYYLTDRAGISHENNGRLFLWTSRVLAMPLISIHETTHLVLSANHSEEDSSPEDEQQLRARAVIWLSEGLASYTACLLAPKLGIPNKSLFLKGDNSTVDDEAKEWIADKRGASVLPYVGSHGVPENILADRANVARPFYVLSQSFVKYLVEQVGISTTGTLYTEQAKSRGAVETQFFRITGRQLSDVRIDWLQHLGKQ